MDGEQLRLAPGRTEDRLVEPRPTAGEQRLKYRAINGEDCRRRRMQEFTRDRALPFGVRGEVAQNAGKLQRWTEPGCDPICVGPRRAEDCAA